MAPWAAVAQQCPGHNVCTTLVRFARLLGSLPVNFNLAPLAASAPHFSQGELAAGLMGRNFVGSVSGPSGADLGR